MMNSTKCWKGMVWGMFAAALVLTFVTEAVRLGVKVQ